MHTVLCRILLIAFLCIPAIAFSERPIPENALVATVHEVPIQYREIRIEPDRLKEIADHSSRFKDSQAASSEELKTQLENRNLVERIKRIIRDRKKSEWKIEVTPDEIQLAKKRAYSELGISFDADANPTSDSTKKFVEYYRKLIAALEATNQGKMDPSTAHSHFELDRFFDLDSWNNLLESYSSEEKIDSLKSIMAKTERNELKVNYESALESELQTEKMNQKIDQLIAAEDAEFWDYIQAKKSGNHTLLNRYPSGYLQQMRENWWINQYRSAPVAIHLERFAEVRKLFKMNP